MCSLYRSLALIAGILALTACQREKRELRPAPVRLAVFSDAARESPLQPGGPQPEPQVTNPYNSNAYAISEGKRLYNWYNCSGCHANGGSGIGPPLIKQEWIYGDQPANLFDTIVKGRPNGMPSWGGRIPEYQIWQIIAYIKSLNNEQPRSANSRPARCAGKRSIHAAKQNHRGYQMSWGRFFRAAAAFATGALAGTAAPFQSAINPVGPQAAHIASFGGSSSTSLL